MLLHEYLKDKRGGGAELARKLGIASPLISQWAHGVRLVPPDRCPSIEEATEGAVTCDELRPDLKWKRKARDGWKWHASGRPLLDLTEQA